MKKITVLGGSGFVGTSLVARLDELGHQVKVLVRRREAAKHLILLPNVDVVQCDLHDDHALKAELENSETVINLVGILHEQGKQSFEQMHHQLPKRLVQLCEELHIKRFMHVSALQASDNAPSAYLRSKAAGETAVNEYSKKLNTTIFRPSVIFGKGDSFFNLFANLVKFLPVIFLAKPEAKFQPIWVEDVVSCMVNALNSKACYGKTYDIGGPKVYTLKSLIALIMDMLDTKRPIIGLNDKLSYLQAFFMELLPIKLMTRDNVKSMEVDNVTSRNHAPELCVELMPLEAIVPEYINQQSPRTTYNEYRTEAGRAINAKR